jgi:hypothetical protein
MSTYDYQLLRVKTGFADDPDYSATQSPPPELVVIAPQKESIVNVQVELVVEWLDGADAVVAGKGSFDIHVVRVIDRPDASQIVVDSTLLQSVGNRALLIDDTRAGDQLGVRLSNIVPPGAGAAKCRVLYKEGLE